ncbi:acetylornithine deacetylase [Marinicaulis flavus]|uniref:Acetylornithine deacetylase n=2 Tax=Hyphococcus luteus TaxID=2058213 RepID=A0A2S7JZ19_9PROT|nr:hydrolase [Marinicaulis flavus]PQA85499.1 acetylornithine deacetylase [Marinicaulis flavus]
MTAAHNYKADLAFLDDRRGPMTETLRAWCAINSGSANLAGLKRMHAALCEGFAGLGAEIETVPSRPHQIVTEDGEVVEQPVGDMLRLVKRPQAPVRVLLTGHMDTVFGEDHPFQSERFLDDDTLNAPGAADMKGGLLVMLNALMAIENSPLAERVGYEVLINADEEIGSIGSAHMLTEAAKRAQFACVYEPALADGTLAGARKGSGNFSAVIRGKSAHAGREHHLGRNALVAAADFIAGIDKLSGQREGLTVNVARLDGGGPNNVVPDLAVARFNVRLEQPADSDWLLEQANALIAEIDAREGYSAKLEGGFTRPPKPMTAQLEAFFLALRATGEELGINIDWVPTGGCCDGNNIAAAGIPVIDTLGVRGANIHSAQEIAKLDSLVERAKLSALLLLKIAAGDLPNPGAFVAEKT